LASNANALKTSRHTATTMHMQQNFAASSVYGSYSILSGIGLLPAFALGQDFGCQTYTVIHGSGEWIAIFGYQEMDPHRPADRQRAQFQLGQAVVLKVFARWFRVRWVM